MKIFSSITGMAKGLPARFFSLLKRRKKFASLVAGILIVLLFTIIFTRGGAPSSETADHVRTVATESVAVLSSQTGPLPALGTIRSESEAILRFERAGEVSGVYSVAGRFVPAGTVIAELKNASERASVAQAQASVAQAEANLSKVQKGSRDEQLSILEINKSNAETALRNSRESIVNTLLSAYNTVRDSVLQKADQTFSNPRSGNPTFNLPTSDFELANSLPSKRVAVEVIITSEETRSISISTSSNLELELSRTLTDLRDIAAFLDDLALALNKAISTPSFSATDIASFETAVATARTNVSTSLSAVTAAQSELETKKTALAVAEKNLEQGVTGERVEDILSAEASVASARASLASAVATLEKTRARTPISGTVSTLSVSRGDFVSAFDLAAIVSNSNALQVETFVAEQERNSVLIGSSVLIDGAYEGTVTSVASGIDPTTGKVAVRIGINDTDADLTHGTTVRLSINRALPETSAVTDISIPISALKVEADRMLVFTVSTDGVLLGHPVVVGALLGDRIVIQEGLRPEMEIVLDARGLSEGDTVNLAE